MKTYLLRKAICGSSLLTLLTVSLLLFTSVLQNANAQTGYLYVHNKSISEDINQSFTFSVSGGATVIPNFTLEDQQLYIEGTDIGAGHGTGGGELWIVAGATKGADGAVYHRAAGTTTWNIVNSVQACGIDGADLGHFVSVNNSGDAFVYDGQNYTKIYDHTISAVKAVDISNNGSITIGNAYTAIVDANGHVWKYTGDYAATFTWTDITPFDNSLSKFTRLDINPSTNDVVLTDAVSCVTKVDSNGSGLLYYGRGLNSSGSAGDVAVDGNGVVYSISKDITGMDAVYRCNGAFPLIWKEEPQTGLHYILTCGDAGQAWIIRGVTMAQQSSFAIPSTIFTRVGDGSAVWIDDERVQTSQNDNAIMIPVAPGTYTITEANTPNWNLQKIDIFDSAAGSSANVAANSVTVIVAANQVAHVLFTNGLVSPTAISDTAGATNIIENFGSGAANVRGAPLSGFTDFHYYNNTSKNTTPDGYYSLTQNSSQWGNNTLTDHTGLPNGYFMMVNASYTPNVFYKQRVTGLVPGRIYMLSFYAANLSPSSPLQPMILAGITDTSSGLTIGSVSTGSLVTDNGWHQYIFSFIATVTTGDLFLQNNALGGFGNDLAIDDISLGSVFELLPVNLISFGAQKNDQSVNVQWSGTAQLNFDHFDLERSPDGKNWNSITTVNGAGNSAAVTDYSYNDMSPVNGNNYYRLKEVDVNGNAKYSGTKMVSMNNTPSTIISTYPNPFVSSVQVQTTADKSQLATVRLINTNGQVVYTKNIQLTAGQNNFTLDGLNSNAKGFYIFELQKDNSVTQQKMMKQ